MGKRVQPASAAPGPLDPVITARDAAALKARGKELRRHVTRDALCTHGKPKRDPVAIVEASNRHRLKSLIPIRYARMSHSPFTFYRGAAALMAKDIGPAPSPGLSAQICGDCHLGNFGGFASPSRALLFGINDFDETVRGKFEWDLKRLAASFHIAAREQSLSEAKCSIIVRRLVRTYCERMGQFAAMKTLELWYQHIDLPTLIAMAHSANSRANRIAMAERAVTRTSDHAFPKLAEISNGVAHIKDQRPLIFHPRNMPDFTRDVHRFWATYVASMPDEIKPLLERYQLVDVAMKVVGVGSVGTRCAIALLMAHDNDPLFLQFKEADTPVYQPFGATNQYANHGQRVVVGQRLMQEASDVFLGWARAEDSGICYYVRQLQDMKISLVAEHMDQADFEDYAEACAWALARAHAKSGDVCALNGYLGGGTAMQTSMATFAQQYADQNESDFEALKRAIAAGRIVAAGDEAQL